MKSNVGMQKNLIYILDLYLNLNNTAESKLMNAISISILMY